MFPEPPSKTFTPRNQELPALSYLPSHEEEPVVYWLQHCRTLHRSWKRVGAIAVGTTLLALVVAFVQPRRYHASATLEIQGITDNFLNARADNQGSTSDSEVSDIQTQIRIIQSENLRDRAIARFLPKGPPLIVEARKAALLHLAKSLAVRSPQQTRLIEISADASDPHLASDFVNVLVTEFIDQHIEARWEGPQRSNQKLKLALDDMRSQLEKSEGALQDYARTSGILLTADRNSVNEDSLRLFQSELSHAQSDRVLRQARFGEVFRATDLELPAIVNNAAIESAQAKLTDLRRQLAELSATYTRDYPKVKRLDAQLAPLESAISKEVMGAKDRIRSEFEESKRREELIASAYRAQAGQVSVEAERRVHYDVLRREVDSTRSIYDAMLARVKEAGIASALRSSNIRVLDAARPLTVPFQPKPLQMAMLGCLAGLFFGSVFVVTREQANITIRVPGDVARLLNLPELGAIPSSRTLNLNPADILADNHSRMAEALRSVVASVVFATPSGSSRVLALTGSQAGDGVTTITAHLGVALAQIGMRVLVVDGNFQSPGLHTALRMVNVFGLSDLLARSAWLQPADLIGAFQKTAHPLLKVLSAGKERHDSRDLLYSPRLRELFEYARKNFDIVLVDTPPLLQIPDARVIGRVSDAVVMVVRAGRTPCQAAMTVRQRLLEDQTPMTGCVLNNCISKKSPGSWGFRAALKAGDHPLLHHSKSA